MLLGLRSEMTPQRTDHRANMDPQSLQGIADDPWREHAGAINQEGDSRCTT
ncbi:hypothetical protein KR100_01585 [Synechococcus sp. KORDI-100]|nr:hypothetical protein KR100_01585 [Synechococcus sp. KORDI-100]